MYEEESLLSHVPPLVITTDAPSWDVDVVKWLQEETGTTAIEFVAPAEGFPAHIEPGLCVPVAGEVITESPSTSTVLMGFSLGLRIPTSNRLLHTAWNELKADAGADFDRGRISSSALTLLFNFSF